MAKKPEAKQSSKKKTDTRWKRAVRRIADSPLPAIALVSTFILARWWNNSDFSYPSEILVPIGLLALIITPIFYGLRAVFGPGLPTQLATVFLSWCLYSYSHLINSFPAKQLLGKIPDSWLTDFNQSLLTLLGLILVSLAVGWGASWLLRRFDRLAQLQPYKVFLFAILFIFAVQVVRSGMRLAEISGQLAYEYPPASLPAPTAQPKAKPDVYYLVFDRYGNKEALAKNYGFDNSDLYEYMDEQGFYTREDAYTNYPFTMSSVSSAMAMSYFPEFEKKFGDSGKWQSAFAYRDILNNPPIAQTLRKHGYSYNQVSSWWDFTRVGIQADSEPTKSFVFRFFGADYFLSDLERDILNTSVLGPWFKKGISVGKSPVLKYDLARNPQENFEAQVSALKSIAERTDKSTPQFSFAHVLLPHDPYIFMPDGSTPTYDSARTDNGVDEKVKYINQVTYVNKRIKELIGHIRAKSPDAAIIIQSDEGPYPKEFRYELGIDSYYDPITLDQQKMQQKFSILASYYLPGVDPASEPIDTSVNAFRFFLREYLGYKDLEPLPTCHFTTGGKYVVYKYQEATQELTGKPADPACKQFDPVP